MSDPVANRAHIAAEVQRLERRQNGGIPPNVARDWIVELVLAAKRQGFAATDITSACAAVEEYVRDPHRPLRDRGRVQYVDLVELARAARDRRRAAAAYTPEARQITASARREVDSDAAREAERRTARVLAAESLTCMWRLPDEFDWKRREGEALHTWEMRVDRIQRRAAEIWEALVDMQLDELRQVRDKLAAKVVALRGHEGLLSAVGRVGEMR